MIHDNLKNKRKFSNAENTNISKTSSIGKTKNNNNNLNITKDKIFEQC